MNNLAQICSFTLFIKSKREQETSGKSAVNRKKAQILQSACMDKRFFTVQKAEIFTQHSQCAIGGFLQIMRTA